METNRERERERERKGSKKRGEIGERKSGESIEIQGEMQSIQERREEEKRGREERKGIEYFWQQALVNIYIDLSESTLFTDYIPSPRM